MFHKWIKMNFFYRYCPALYYSNRIMGVSLSLVSTVSIDDWQTFPIDVSHFNFHDISSFGHNNSAYDVILA